MTYSFLLLPCMSAIVNSDLLMESAVSRDDTGVTFDSQHPSWKKLIKLVIARSPKPSKDQPKADQKSGSAVSPKGTSGHKASRDRAKTNKSR